MVIPLCCTDFCVYEISLQRFPTFYSAEEGLQGQWEPCSVEGLPEKSSLGAVSPAFKHQVLRSLPGPAVAETGIRECFFDSVLVDSDISNSCF